MENGFNQVSEVITEKTFARKGSSRIHQLMNRSLHDSSYCMTDAQNYAQMPEEISDQYLMAKFGDHRRNTEQAETMKEINRVKSHTGLIQSHRPVSDFNINIAKAQARESSPSGVPPYSDRSSKLPEQIEAAKEPLTISQVEESKQAPPDIRFRNNTQTYLAAELVAQQDSCNSDEMTSLEQTVQFGQVLDSK